MAVNASSRLGWILPGLLATSLLMTSCGEDSEGGSSGGKQTIGVGTLVTTNGDSAFVGVSASNAFPVAEEIINADPEKYLGSAERSIDISVNEAGETTTQASTVTKQLAGDTSILAMVGPSTSPQALAIGPIAQAASVPLLVPHSPADGITDPGEFVFQIAGTNDVQAAAVVNAVVPAMGLTKVGVITTPDNPANVAAHDSAVGALEDLGVEYVEGDVSYDSTDYTAVISKMRDAEVDGIFIATNSQGVASGMQQADRTGLDVQWMGGPQLASSLIFENGGPEAIGTILATDYNPNLDTELAAEFRDAYLKQADDTAADTFSAQAFSSALVIAAAVKSIPAEDEVTREALAKALASLDATDVVLGEGTLTFGEDRHSKTVPALLQLDDSGSYVPYTP